MNYKIFFSSQVLLFKKNPKDNLRKKLIADEMRNAITENLIILLLESKN